MAITILAELRLNSAGSSPHRKINCLTVRDAPPNVARAARNSIVSIGHNALETVKSLFLLVVLGFGLGCLKNARAASFVWTGHAPAPNSLDWNNQQNWSPNNQGVPGAGDSASIGGEGTNGTLGGYFVVLTTPVTVKDLSITASTITGTGLTINGTLEYKVSSIFIGGTLTIAGMMNVDPATYARVSESDLACASLVNNGTVTIRNGAFLNCINAPTMIVNNTTFTLEDNATMSVGSGASGSKFNNIGTFKAGNSTVSGFGSTSIFQNGTGAIVDVESGRLQLDGSGGAAGYVNAGTFQTGSGGIIDVQGAIKLQNSFYTGAGTTLLNHVTADGLATVSGHVEFGGGWVETGTLEIRSGGTFRWTGGVIRGDFSTNATSLVKVDAGAQLILDGFNPLQLLQTQIDNHGSITWTNTADFALGNEASVMNERDGVFEAQNDAVMRTTDLPNGDANATFKNYGKFKKTFGTTNLYTGIDVPFSATGGSVSVGAGTLRFYQGSDGSFTSATLTTTQGAVLEFYGGDHTFASTFATGSGQILLDGTANLIVAFGNNFHIACDFELAGGSVAGSGSCRVSSGGILNWTGGSMYDAGTTVIEAGGLLNILGGGTKNIVERSLINQGGGRIVWSGSGPISTDRSNTVVVVDNQSAAIFEIQGDAIFHGSLTPTLYNEGLLKKTGAGGTTRLSCNVTNTGTIEGDSGILEIAYAYADNTGTGIKGTLVANAGATIKFDQNLFIEGTISGSGTIQAPLIVNNGELDSGGLHFKAYLNNNGRQVAGDAPGFLSVQNDFGQSAAGTLVIPIQGTNASTPDFGQLLVAGAASLGGTLEVGIENGFAPAVGNQFPFLACASRKGTFSNLHLPAGFALNYSSTGAVLTVTGPVPVQMISPSVTAGNFGFQFGTINGRSYTIQSKNDLTAANWTFYTNFTGNGTLSQLVVPLRGAPQKFFRVSEP